MLSHMFSFMRQSKKMRSQAAAAGGGIYLDDLNVDSLDPELARLYITQSSFPQKLHSSHMNYPLRWNTKSMIFKLAIFLDTLMIKSNFPWFFLIFLCLIVCSLKFLMIISNFSWFFND